LVRRSPSVVGLGEHELTRPAVAAGVAVQVDDLHRPGGCVDVFADVGRRGAALAAQRLLGEIVVWAERVKGLASVEDQHVDHRHRPELLTGLWFSDTCHRGRANSVPQNDRLLGRLRVVPGRFSGASPRLGRRCRVRVSRPAR
jgi:hypothetical protein